MLEDFFLPQNPIFHDLKICFFGKNIFWVREKNKKKGEKKKKRFYPKKF